MAWNKQQLTEEQKKAATELFSKWEDEGGFGEQPWVCLDEDGKVLKQDRGAVCLASFNFMALRNKPRNPVLFQMKINDTIRPNSYLVATDGFINRYLAWVVRSPMCQQWLCKHTAADRNNFGIPIALNDVPRNVPLLVSTHIRYFWDVNNKPYHKPAIYLKEQGLCTWAEAFAIGSLLGWVPGMEDRCFTIQSWSDCHSPFGHNVSVEMWRKYIQGTIDLEDYDASPVDLTRMSRGIGIEDMFKQGQTPLNNALLTLLEPFQAEKGRFYVSYKKDAFNQIISTLIDFGRGKI